MIGIPAIIIWSVILGRNVKLHVYDDNAAMIQVMTTGKNPTMRGLGITHGVSINRLYELFQEDWNTLTKVDKDHGGRHFHERIRSQREMD